MAITTYGELKTAVARWVGGSDASDATSLGVTSTIDDLITIAEARIFRETRTKDTETAFAATITGASIITLSADYVMMKYAYIDGTPVQSLERRSAEWIYSNNSNRTATGKPKYFAREAGNFIFGPAPDSAYTVKGVYYKRLAALSTTNHALFTNNPDLYWLACMSEAELLVGKDERIKIWETKYQKILADVNGFDRAEYASGSVLVMRPG